MVSINIFLSLSIFSLGPYLIWPSRYNVPAHLVSAFCFVAYFVPAVILNVQDDYPVETVNFYSNLLLFSAVTYVISQYIGFKLGKKKLNLSLEILAKNDYERRVLKITKMLMIFGSIALVICYIVMGFVPAFAPDPITAKLFRGAYEAPYRRVDILYRFSFYVLVPVTPIAIVIWYQTKQKLFLILSISAIFLMGISLQRGPAFEGIVLASAVILCFSSKLKFWLFMFFLFFLFAFSSVFYYVIDIKKFDTELLKSKHPYWEIVSGETSDIRDQLNFLHYFQDNPQWTYGRTIYGGLIPGHYDWNPSVYTLKVVNPGSDINDIESGGFRLPTSLWGYVAFGWFGAALFSIISGFFTGYFYKYLKYILLTKESLIIKVVVILIFLKVLNIFMGCSVSVFYFPPAIILIFYMYRFRLKPRDNKPAFN